MNEMLGSTTDLKNIGVAEDLWRLRQALDVYCLISANCEAIKKVGVGQSFFGFLQISCVRLIILYIGRVFEKETLDKQGAVKYELNSIDGVLSAIDNEKARVLKPDSIRAFAQKYGSGSDEDGLAAILAVVKTFREQNYEASGFKTLRDKWVAHHESGFTSPYGPSYDHMERMCDFGKDLFELVSRAFLRTSPADLNRDRQVKRSLKGMLQRLGCEEIKTDME